MWLVGGFLSAVWVGTQALTSRRAGEGHDLLAGRVLTNSIVIAAVSSVTFSILAILLTPMILESLYSDAVVIGYAVDYLQIRYVGVLAMVGTFSYKSFFDGIGRTKVFMTAAVVMNLMNVLLNFWLIYGYAPLDIPKMGVAGAAWASVISAYIGLIILILFSFAPRTVKRYKYYRVSNLNGQVTNSILKLSLPNGAATIVVMLGFSAFYWVVGQVNDLYAQPGNPVIMTAKDVVIWATMPSFMTSMAFGSATAAVVSQSLGARRPYLAERYATDALKLWAYVMWVFGAFMFVFPDLIIGLFNSDPEVIEAARTPLRLIAAPHGIIAIAMILTQTLYGVGDARFVMKVELFLHLFVMSPIAYVFAIPLGLGLNGIWAGPLIYMAALMMIMFWKFRRGDWKQIEI
jgi:putative MATE family efflux protein